MRGCAPGTLASAFAIGKAKPECFSGTHEKDHRQLSDPGSSKFKSASKLRFNLKFGGPEFGALTSHMHSSNTDLYPVLAGIGVALVFFIAFSIWSRRFGAKAVERWATAKGLQVVSVRRRSFVPQWRLLRSRRFQFFRVTVRDKAGSDYRAWMRLEADCTDPEVLEVTWDDGAPSA